MNQWRVHFNFLASQWQLFTTLINHESDGEQILKLTTVIENYEQKFFFAIFVTCKGQQSSFVVTYNGV